MRSTLHVLVKTLVRQFYRRSAGQLVFLFILFIGAVGELEGQLKYTGPLHQFHYQYALIVGMLSHWTAFMLVFLVWLLYAEKNAQFVLESLQRADHSFLDLLNNLAPKKRWVLLLRVQSLLFLPVLLYSLTVIGVAIYKGWYLSGLAVMAYIITLNLVTVARYQYQLEHPGGRSLILLPGLRSVIGEILPYRESISMGIRSLVRPFYRQNAGFFLFIFLVFFGVVAPSQQLAYHYALILGVLNSALALGVVLLAWLLYAEKCRHWVGSIMESPDHSYLQLLSRLDKRGSFTILLIVQFILILPVWVYALAITGVALYKGQVIIAVGVQLYILLLCVASAARYQYGLMHPGIALIKRPKWMHMPKGLSEKKKGPSYWSFFIRYLFYDGKALVLGIKLTGCALLYLLLRERDPAYYDIRMPFLLYTIVLFGHGVLIYRCRALEEKNLSFYRGLPVPLLQRGLQYGMLYFLVLLPEMLTLCWLTPVFIRWKDTLGFILSGYSLLLLLNSVLFIAPLKMSDFLKLSLGIFGILYFCVLGDVVIALSGGFFVVAGCLFFWGYWRYQN